MKSQSTYNKQSVVQYELYNEGQDIIEFAVSLQFCEAGQWGDLILDVRNPKSKGMGYIGLTPGKKRQESFRVSTVFYGENFYKWKDYRLKINYRVRNVASVIYSRPFKVIK